MTPESLTWLESLAKEDRIPVLRKSEFPNENVLRSLRASDLLIRIPGGLYLIRRPGATEQEVIQQLYWPIIERIQEGYSPCVLERESAVRVYIGIETPPPKLRLRQGRNKSTNDIKLTRGLSLLVSPGIIDVERTRSISVAGIPISLDDPVRVLFGLQVSVLKENLDEICTWLQSLLLPREEIEQAYDEFPRPVVIRRLAHLAIDAGNEELASSLNSVVRKKQNVRIGRGQTGVGKALLVPSYIRRHRTTRRPWLDRLNNLMALFQDQITQVLEDSEFLQLRNDMKDLIDQAREAKTFDLYHSTSIEGYRLRYEDVSVILGGDPAGGLSEVDVKNRMAVLGYSRAFDSLLERFESTEIPVGIDNKLIFDLYVSLFYPSVEAGIVGSDQLAEWRSAPVFIRNTTYVPPSAGRIPEMMDVFISNLEKVADPVSKAILCHLILVSIHPFPDGNGRVGRFLMNTAFLNGHRPWLTIREYERDIYFRSLRQAQLEDDASAFAKFIVGRLHPNGPD
ncbi:MAG: Fic family protein [Rhodothermia bacterium]|nr:MAG: Fic family protein [Rhodothermia bacterium]